MTAVRRPRIYLMVLLVLFSAAVTLPQRRAGQGNARRTRSAVSGDAARSGTEQTQAMELICQVYCDPIKPGTGVAELVWKISNTELTPMGFNARLREQDLEVTVFKEGFSKGLYANLFSMQRHTSLRALSDDGANRELVPGVEGLVVVSVGRLEDASAEGDDGRQRFRVERFGVRPFGEEDADAVVVKIEGLEPGLNYFWRVPASVRGRRVVSEVVQCKAPVCPSDMRTDEEETP